MPRPAFYKAPVPPFTSWLLAGQPCLLLLLWLGLPSQPGGAAGPCLELNPLPAALQPFVDPDICVVTVERADINGDGREDYIVVLDRMREPMSEEPRALLIVLADSDGSRVMVRSERAILCPACGGAFGDPFEGINVTPGEITISHMGGAGWRWRADFTFRYAPADDSWLLARVNEVSYHASDPEKTMTTRISRPPQDFGRIDLQTFDAEAWMERER